MSARDDYRAYPVAGTGGDSYYMAHPQYVSMCGEIDRLRADRVRVASIVSRLQAVTADATRAVEKSWGPDSPGYDEMGQ